MIAISLRRVNHSENVTSRGDGVMHFKRGYPYHDTVCEAEDVIDRSDNGPVKGARKFLLTSILLVYAPAYIRAA